MLLWQEPGLNVLDAEHGRLCFIAECLFASQALVCDAPLPAKAIAKGILVAMALAGCELEALRVFRQKSG